MRPTNFQLPVKFAALSLGLYDPDRQKKRLNVKLCQAYEYHSENWNSAVSKKKQVLTIFKPWQIRTKPS